MKVWALQGKLGDCFHEFYETLFVVETAYIKEHICVLVDAQRLSGAVAIPGVEDACIAAIEQGARTVGVRSENAGGATKIAADSPHEVRITESVAGEDGAKPIADPVEIRADGIENYGNFQLLPNLDCGKAVRIDDVIKQDVGVELAHMGKQ